MCSPLVSTQICRGEQRIVDEIRGVAGLDGLSRLLTAVNFFGICCPDMPLLGHSLDIFPQAPDNELLLLTKQVEQHLLFFLGED